MEYLRQQLLSNSHEGSFELTSKRITSWYFDTRPLLLDSHAGRMIAGLFFSRVHSNISVVAGTGISGSLIVSMILGLTCKPMKGLIVRGRERKHGLRKIVEGDALISNCDVTFVDDLISTGSSFQRTRTVLESQRKCKIVQAIFLIDRSIEPIDLGIPTTYFFRASETGTLETYKGGHED